MIDCSVLRASKRANAERRSEGGGGDGNSRHTSGASNSYKKVMIQKLHEKFVERSSQKKCFRLSVFVPSYAPSFFRNSWSGSANYCSIVRTSIKQAPSRPAEKNTRRRKRRRRQQSRAGWLHDVFRRERERDGETAAICRP